MNKNSQLSSREALTIGQFLLDDMQEHMHHMLGEMTIMKENLANAHEEISTIYKT